jgi:2-polyprenyl-6-methoxyphenol hydroxylase-like FAD-dependent oxidoreductase
MTEDPAHRVSSRVDVAICGGGPVGLSLAYLLGRAGARVALFERRPSTTTLPKGQYLHASTGEFFRQWGVWALLRDAGWSTEVSNGQGFYVDVAHGPVAMIRAIDGNHGDYVAKWTEVETLGTGVRLVVQDEESQLGRQVQARYLVACDGAHSFVRSRLGQGQDQGPTFGNQILVEFRAALEDSLGADGFFHAFILHPLHAGWFGSQHPETGLWRYSFRHDEESLPEPALVLERIQGALGMPDLPIEIVRFHRFDYSTGLLRRWREGPVFFAGDAAHWNSPWGGYGMNSGVQDANNLAWKLDLVLRGLAHDSLLDTYELERRSKALLTVKAATYNSLHYQAIAEAVRVGEGALLREGRISPEAVSFLRQRVAPHGENSVLHTGYQLGTVYDSPAICAGGEAPPIPTLRDYVETTVPGVRAPHAWLLDPDGSPVSTIDLWGRHFTLVGHRLPAHWAEACSELARILGLEISLLNVGMPGGFRPRDEKFARLFAARAGEVTLVRPDGFVAARLGPEDPALARLALEDVLRQVLGLPALASLTLVSPSTG